MDKIVQSLIPYRYRRLTGASWLVMILAFSIAGPAQGASRSKPPGERSQSGRGLMLADSGNPEQSGSDLQTLDGRQLFRQDCGRCHALPRPSQHSPGQWPAVVRRMQHYVARYGGRPLPDAEVKAIVSYLQKHARN